MKDQELIFSEILNCAFKVHTTLGPGLLESVYEACLAHEIKKKGMKYKQQYEVPIVYDTLEFNNAFRLDLFVENRIVIELKSVERLRDVHVAQTLTYMRLIHSSLGLLINFNESRLKYGIKRLVL